MADFNSILEQVYTITNRSDLVAETKLAIKSATLQLHRSEYFYKDIFETALQFETKDFLQTIDYRTLFPRYRSLKYLRKFDPLNNYGNMPSIDVNERDIFTIITPEEVLNSYGGSRTNVVYVAGSVIQVKSNTAIQFAVIGIYQNPDVSESGYTSWIADESEFAIIYKAASIVFGTILGDSARRSENDAQAQLEMQQIRNSNIIAEGY